MEITLDDGSPFLFLDPWWSTDGKDAQFHSNFLGEFQLEVGPGHALFGLPVRMLARHGGSDDTLFELLDQSGRVAVVHLTWARRREEPPWPWTEIYPNLAAFEAERMVPEHRESLDTYISMIIPPGGHRGAMPTALGGHAIASNAIAMPTQSRGHGTRRDVGREVR